MQTDDLISFVSGYVAIDWSAFAMPTPGVFSVIALLGYLAGHFGRPSASQCAIYPGRDLKRARALIEDMEATVAGVHTCLRDHWASVARYRELLCELGTDSSESDRQALCWAADEMLKPTQQLAAQIIHAYDELRCQSNQLMSFSETKTDPLTRISNRSSLDETLDSMFALLNRYGQPFAAALVDIDHFRRINEEVGHLRGDAVLQSVAKLLDANVRESDVVARYDGARIVVLMPCTNLDGAASSSDRLRAMVDARLSATVSCGVAVARPGDTPANLLARLEAALERAKTGGRNRISVDEPQVVKKSASAMPAAGMAVA